MLARGNVVLESYWEQPEESAAALEGGWDFHQVKPHMFGELPRCADTATRPDTERRHG